MNVKGKIYFAAGAVVGLLTGSRLGRGLYDRTAKAAGALAGNPTVRSGVTSAGGRAVDAAKSAGGGVGHKVSELRRHAAEKHAERSIGNEDEREMTDAEAADAAAGRRGPEGWRGGHLGGHLTGHLPGHLGHHHRADRYSPSTTGSANGTIGSAGSSGGPPKY